MIEGIPKISVLIICYKQEELIKRAINSLLAQKDYIYEICVSDDCSPDRTWEVLQEYDKQYPGLFKLHQNRPNVGIFENIEYTWTMPTGDIIYQLSGDDECGEGWFKTVIEYIQNNHIDYQNELFCIYGDYKCVYPNGDSFVFHNDEVNKNQNLLKLALRGLIGNRSCCFSKRVLDKFVKCSKGRSHIAEDAQDRQLQVFSEANYYIPKVGNIYYSYVGVSTQTTDDVLAERVQIRLYAIEIFKQQNVKLDNYDIVYSLELFPIYERFLCKQTTGLFFKMIHLYFKSMDPKIRISRNQIRHLIFAIRRRLPHKQNIEMS